MAMQTKLTQKKYQTLMSWLADSLVRLSQSQAIAKDLMIREEHCFLKLHEYLKLNAQDCAYLKMSKGCLVMMGERHSKPSSARLMSWGTMSSGKYLTAKISACHRTESGCLLLDILEPASSVPDKYFLSQAATDRLLGYQATRQTHLQRDTDKRSAPVHISVGRMR